MTWAEITALVAAAGLIGGLIGWILPSPVQMQERISTLEKDMAVLVSTVSALQKTVYDWIQYTRGMTPNGDHGGSGRRSRL